MHTIEVIGTQTTWNYPASGHDFSLEQFVAFSRLLSLYNAEAITFQELKVHLVYEFLNLKRTADLSQAGNELIVENVNSISKLNDGFFEDTRIDGKPTKVIKMDFIEQKIPHINVDGHTFYGPATALTNTVWGEYIATMTHFNDFVTNNDVHALDLMIATIYRPKKQNFEQAQKSEDFDGDTRVKFNSNITPVYADIIKGLDFATKYAIYLFVASCQHFIANNEALDIGGGNTIDLTLLFNQEKSKSSANSLGLVGTLYSLAQTNVFGDIKAVANQNTFDVLAFLVQQTIEHKKEEERLKKMRQKK